MMKVNVNKAIFRIVKTGEQFAIVVRYESKVIIAKRGSLAFLKPKFTAIVNNRELLQPVIERALGYEQASA
jgi:hypothetical protein